MPEEIKQKLIEEEMKESYIDYAMSVITSRALPDVRDGLKPVHRRILFAMNELGLQSNKQTKKSARIVGETLGKWHPHGDIAVYDALARMAQDFSLRYPLVIGQGNFGSIDGDSPAAQRYTEAKLSRIAEEILQDIDKETVNFIPNFDGSLKEPVVLPSKIPNLLINGSSGIAVGMATNIPPHNITEISEGIIAQINNPEITIQELMHHIKGPDFPTSAIICNLSGIKQIYETGKGKLIIKSKTQIEKDKIIITEIPYQLNKSSLLENIASLVRDEIIQDISDIRDESDREGIRIVIELKKNANANIVLNQLMKHGLQISYNVMMLALVNNIPKILTLKDLINEFIAFRKEVVTRRTNFELSKAEKRFHILEGLKIALNEIDNVVKLIKNSDSIENARNSLIENLTLTIDQANAILDMKLQRLTSLEQERLRKEQEELTKLIQELKTILSSEQNILEVIKKEIHEIRGKYEDKRKTQIVEDKEVIDEDLIQEEDVVIISTYSGYIKQLPLSVYKQQKRGGKGMIGTETKEEDIVEHLFVTSNLNTLLFFTNKGKLYFLKAYEIPSSGRYSKGKAIINLLNLEENEKINAILPIKKFDNEHYLLFITKNGILKKTNLIEYAKQRNGIKAINLKENDEVIDVKLTDNKSTFIIATKNGSAVKFNEKDVRNMGRNASGVRGIKLINDEVIGMGIAPENSAVLTVTENGYGKRTSINDYRLIKRGGKGVTNIITSERNGKVAAVKTVFDNDEIMLITKKGIIIRIPVKDISIVGRNTQGVRLMKLEDDKVNAVARIEKE